MADPYYFEDARANVEELEKYQIINAYTLYRAMKLDKSISLKDFCDLRSDIENEYNNLKDFHKI